jgi:hypothetical protein
MYNFINVALELTETLSMKITGGACNMPSRVYTGVNNIWKT